MLLKDKSMFRRLTNPHTVSAWPMTVEDKELFVKNLGFDRKKVLFACLFSLLTT